MNSLKKWTPFLSVMLTSYRDRKWFYKEQSTPVDKEFLKMTWKSKSFKFFFIDLRYDPLKEVQNKTKIQGN